MSTRSYICMEVGDDQYKTIYCHSDGYLSHNGALLLKYYSDRETVERLLERGGLVFPGEEDRTGAGPSAQL